MVSSLTKVIVGVAQLSVAVGVSAKAALIPTASEHSKVASKSPGVLSITGAVVSTTVIV